MRDLGLTNGATTDQIYAKAQEFGLELCPAEVGPHYRLTYTNQPMGEEVRIAMKQIIVPGGSPRIFNVLHREDGLWLNTDWVNPDFRWLPSFQFVFRLPSSGAVSAPPRRASK